MSYCDDCILLDICGKEGCCDEAMTFCADKNKFIYVSILDKIRAEIDAHRKTIKDMADTDDWFAGKLSGHDCDIEIIDKYRESEEISDTNMKMWQEIFKVESGHKCHTCKHYTSGEHDGSCGSYICKGYSNWESEEA